MRWGMLLVVLAASLLPSGPAKAECNEIYLFSNVDTGIDDPRRPGRTLGTPSVMPGVAGCSVPGRPVSTDYINPGSNLFVVRWVGTLVPLSGTMTYAGRTIELAFAEVATELGPRLESQAIRVDPATTVAGYVADITVCMPTRCLSRSYRTLA